MTLLSSVNRSYSTPVSADQASTSQAGASATLLPASRGSRRLGADGGLPVRHAGGHARPDALSAPRVSLELSPQREMVPLRDLSVLLSDHPSFRTEVSHYSDALPDELPYVELSPSGSPAIREADAPGGAHESFRTALSETQTSRSGSGDGRADVPARQSWRQMAAAALRHRASAVGSAVQSGGAALGRTAMAPVSVARSGVSAAWNLGSQAWRIPKVVVGHLTHQGISVGVTTAVREVAAEALIAGLRQAPAGALLGIEIGMGIVNMSLQALRQARERRNPDEAARGFHALSPEQWASKTPEEQALLRKEQQHHSDRVASLQMASLMVNVGFAAYGAAHGDNSFAASSIASEAKVIAYSVLRDGIQSKFGMIKLDKESHGVSGSHIAGASLFYGAANLAGGYAWSALPPLGLPPGVTTANVRDVLRGVPVEGVSLQDAVGATAKMVGVKAAINTVLEASDWFSVTEQEARQAGAKQQLAPHIKGNDFGRMKDHVPARIAIIESSNSVADLVGFLTKDMPPSASALLTNSALGLWVGVNYRTIGATWQADSAVRAAEDHRRPAREGAQNV
ncbi:hypothetical protein [Paracidovorax citrulli]|uniref:hypothetical protein n=1 Tax=Paracidovorax citrulli TaxID=80869 RepID=UPI00066274F5|nr:hypothetical protein [Paracidovorax citrulli]QCX11143.1 HpaH [Paracidovorax citrulli]UEG45885.1 hypothetical protein LKW27_19915 [Paracidovorax citrulli]UMT94860.1 hypothetical protein FRC97_07535 [Paracidovorax citrulli]